MANFLPYTVAIICVTAVVGIVDLNCTMTHNESVKFSSSAVDCENKLSNEACEIFYPQSVEAHSNRDRHENCYKNPYTNEVDSELVQLAVSSCPKTCGYCCITNTNI